MHFRNDGRVSGWSLSFGSLATGTVLLILSPLVLSTIFPGWLLTVGVIALVALGVVIHLRWKARVPALNRADAEQAAEQARDWIRVRHGREPRDEDEVYLVARSKFW